jgi:uncharacterized damage-inducible protein DinB
MISSAVKEAWQANLRVNMVLLNHLTPDMLITQTPAGGYTVAQHLAHITGTVKHWGSRMDEAGFGNLPNLYDETNEEDFIAESNKERIEKVMKQTVEVALEISNTALNKGTLPHTSVEAYLIHMMVHDAHHRGQILLALKTAGHSLPDEDAMWGPWRGE